MRILRTYILKELLQPTAMALVLFTFILLVGNLVKLADLLINKGVSLFAIAQMFSLLIPTLMSHTVPLGVLTGTLLAFGKLSGDREILAMRTSGISLLAIAMPVLTVGFIVSLALIPINDRVVPWSHYATRQLFKEVGIRNPTAFLEPGTFIREFKPYILFLYGVEGNKLTKVRIYQPKEGHPTRTIVAERGEFVPIPAERRVVLRLYDGTADEPDTKDPSKFYKLQFATYSVNLDLLKGGADPKSLSRKPKDMSLSQLEEEIGRLEAQDIDTTPLKIEIQNRIAFSFSPFIFMLIAIPMGITTRRAQRSVGFGLSLLVFLGYYLFLILGQALAERGLIAPGPALWMPNMIGLVVGVFLMWRSGKR